MVREELHLIVLWNNARYKEKEIIDDIQKHHKILECIDIKWSSENVASNFTRFYGTKLPSGSHKEIECGVKNFLVITVLDENPVYDFVETSRGFENVNTNIFNLKQLYRSWTKGGHKIHTTNSPKETNHDITLLLGKNYEDYLKSAPQKWDGKIKYIERDLTGCNGWNSLEELFYTLNATTNYVVLRNYEILPESFSNEKHGDIDILSDDYENICYIANTTPVLIEPYRVHNYTVIDGKKVFFDFRYLNDNYYCYNFEKDILNSKILNEKNIFVISNENYFYSLIYHALIHKKKVASDYYDKVYNLYCNIFDETDNRPTFEFYFKLLKDFMRKNNYAFVRPNDKSVFYNQENIDLDNKKEWLEQNYFLDKIESFKIDDSGGAECKYFTGFLNEEKVFVKTGGIGSICQNEFKTTKKLYELNPINFLKPYFYKLDGDIKNIVLEFIEGKDLESLIKDNELDENDKNIIKNELVNIAKTLIEAKIVHRDISPKNLIYTKNKHLKLIDTQWAVYYDNYYEDEAVKLKPDIIYSLSGDFSLYNFEWDDMYSISKIIEALNISDAQSSKNNEDVDTSFIKNNIGKYVIVFPKSIIKKNTKYNNFFERIFSIKNISNSKFYKSKILTILGFKRIVFKYKTLIN